MSCGLVVVVASVPRERATASLMTSQSIVPPDVTSAQGAFGVKLVSKCT